MNRDACEACLMAPVEEEIPTGEAERRYCICGPCARRLENRALRPLEWYRLAALHGPLTFLLHDDFYDQDGTADQNLIPIERAGQFRAPTLAMVASDLDRLLDFAMTRWRLEPDTIDALRAFAPAELLPALTRLEAARSIAWVEGRCFDIAGSIADPMAADWLKARWDRATAGANMACFLRAVSAFGADDETLRRALAAVDRVDERDRAMMALALTGFRSTLVLDWIEQRVRSPVNQSWGWVAARSGLSWHRAERWLEMGRPLSLVALDAIAACLCPAAGTRPPGPEAELVDPPEPSVLIARLVDHARVDPAPRVSLAVARIVRAIEP